MIVVAGRRYRHGATDTQKAWKHIPLLEVDDLKMAIPHGCVPVAVDLIEGARPLTNYSHPERAFYVFGGEDRTLGADVLSWCRDVVYVPTAFCMNLAAAVNVILYDRLAKATAGRAAGAGVWAKDTAEDLELPPASDQAERQPPQTTNDVNMQETNQQPEGGAAVRSSDLLGHSETWFSYDPGDGFETHATEAEARKRAEDALQYYKDEAPSDGWSEEVTQVCWGRCAQKVELLWRKDRPPKDQLDESNCDKDGLAWGEWDEMCDYGLCPNARNSATADESLSDSGTASPGGSLE